MGAGGKKAKAKDKNGKAGTTKQKIKKSKSSEGPDGQRTNGSPAPGSPELALLDQTLVQPAEPELGSAPAAAELIEPDQTATGDGEYDADQSQTPETDQRSTVKDDSPDEATSSKDENTVEPCIETQEKQPPRGEIPLLEPTERTPITSPFTPFSPAPALVPLPSPSLTEARFMSSPSPEAHFHYPASPPFFPYTSPYASPYASPVPKVSSPLARSHYPYMPPTMSPTATPPPPTAAPAPPVPMALPAPPSAIHSLTPAAHSPVMSSAGVVSPYAPCPPHPPDGHFMARSYSIPDSSYAAPFQAIRDLGLGNGQPNENGTISPPENDNEHVELLQRIQAAIPDINRLLHGFRNTHSKLSSREAEMKQIGNQHEQALMHKDFYIEALQTQMKKTANESAEECAKLKNTINELRLEVGNLQEKHKNLEDGLETQQKSNEELSQNKADLEEEIATLNASIQGAREAHEKEREEQKEEHAKELATQKQELTELFEEIKNEDEKAAAEALEAREEELRDQHELDKGEWEKEKASLQENLETQGNELEATKSELTDRLADLESAREEVANKIYELEAKEEEMEEIRSKSAQEVDVLRHAHEEQLDGAAKESDKKIAATEAYWSDKEQHWTAERAALEKLLSDKDSELMSCEREKEKLEGDGLIKLQQLQRAVDEMRSTIDRLDGDCDRLRKTLQSLGEATDLKTTKGDRFFLDCFNQLSHLIHDLAKEHFAYLPIDPPKDILSKIPSELPPFLDNTPASRELRCAYIEHVVSKTITYRVFQPFLFTLGRRYDKADTFFQMLSMDIRRKSVRREAFWRQQTLKAAYTTSDAKQSINVAAAVIVDEIIDHIKHFTDLKHLDSLLTGVRKIVKLAAETWRHARVERELVLAAFPAPDAEGASNEEWQEHGVTKETNTSQTSDPSRHVVLRTFPRILREAAHEDFASGERASSCIYSPGEVLYSDSPIVMARLQELAKKSETVVVLEDAQLSPPETPPKASHEALPVQNVEKLATVPSPPLTVQSAPTSPKV